MKDKTLIPNYLPVWNSLVPTPTELRVSQDRKLLTVAFDSGETFQMTAEYLRVESPSAEVQGHDSSQKKTVPGKKDVQIMKMEPVGNYAVRIIFDDMHDTGIYSWDGLHRLGSKMDELWGNYLIQLQEKGLSR